MSESSPESGSGSESWLSREVQLATSILCSNAGSMQLPQLHRQLLQRCNISEEEFSAMVYKCPRFLLFGGPSGDPTVVARTSLRLCGRYGREDAGCCREDCPQLHLCRYFLFGTCRFGKARKPCKFSHDVRSHHNFGLLRETTLHLLNAEQLLLLLLLNDPALLPQVCAHYNKGSGPFGGCSFQERCSKIHLCQHFVQSRCLFGPRCHRHHDIDPHGRRLLEERGLSGDIVSQLPLIYRNIHHLNATANATANANANATEEFPDSPCDGANQPDDGPEICLHFTRNSCRFQNACRRIHFHLPYRWEVFDGISWTDVEDMEDVERDFCDPSKTQSRGDPPVHFPSMTQKLRPVRRLSTVSSVTKPPHYVLTTKWRWFYRGDGGVWVEYGEPDEKLRTMSVTSRRLEEAFLSDPSAEVLVVKGNREYIVSFADMYQRNLKHHTKRRIRRRPHFVSAAEVENLHKTFDPMWI